MAAGLGIASLKASLVVLHFMHVRYSSRVVSPVVLAGFAFLAILLVLTPSDYATRRWFPFPGK